MQLTGFVQKTTSECTSSYGVVPLILILLLHDINYICFSVGLSKVEAGGIIQLAVTKASYTLEDRQWLYKDITIRGKFIFRIVRLRI